METDPSKDEPKERFQFNLHVRLKTLLPLVSPLLLAVAAAYVQWGTVGLSSLPASPTMTAESAVEPYGFPAWLCVTLKAVSEST